MFLMSPALAGKFFTTGTTWEVPGLFLQLIYFGVHWVFVAVGGFSPVVATEDCSFVAMCGRWLLLKQNTGSRAQAQ